MKSIFSPTERSTLCPRCGGGTYTFGPRGPWCPNHACHPNGGGLFVNEADGAPERTIEPRVIKPRAKRESKPTVEPTFALGYDDFVSGE